jgi:predicted DNA-binding protein (MmcQ/YjbR family)
VLSVGFPAAIFRETNFSFMDHEVLREYCLNKKGVTEEFPFDSDTLVYKLMGKIFLLTGLQEKPLTMNLKCHPELAVELREKYFAVTPGYHMNKKHWNTVQDDGSIPQKDLYKMIDHSYELVASALPKNIRALLEESEGSR